MLSIASIIVESPPSATDVCPEAIETCCVPTAKDIEKYVKDKYKKKKDKTTFIAYGAYLKDVKDIDKKTKFFMDSHGIKKRDYYLIVGRFVPENNYETMIKEFMKSKSNKNFAIITNVNDKFLKELELKLSYS